MSTANFRNHKNGIFVIEKLSEKDAIDFLLESVDSTDITEEMVQDEIEFNYQIEVDNFMDMMKERIEDLDKRYFVELKNQYEALVWSKGKYIDKIVAELKLVSGYYDGVQLIVETDPEYLVYNFIPYDTSMDYYTPNNKRLFKVIRSMTLELKVSAQFSNGETWYSKK